MPGKSSAGTPSPSSTCRADGAPVDGGKTYLVAPQLLAATERLVDQDPRQGWAALGLFVLMATGFSAWQHKGRITSSVAGIARAVGVSPHAARRSLDLLCATDLVTRTASGWAISLALAPSLSGRTGSRSMKAGTKHLELSHREVWAVRQRLFSRDDVDAYHHLRDLGFHLVALCERETHRGISVRADRRTLRRRTGRLHQAELAAPELLVAGPAPTERAHRADAGPVETGPPGGWSAFKEAVLPRAGPKSAA